MRQPPGPSRMRMMSVPQPPSPNPGPPSFWQVVGSVLAAFFGVQSSRNRERDFRHGKPLHFIAIGLAMTALFILGLVVVVRLLMRQNGL